MRVIVAHNRYVSRTPSGENAVVDDEVRALREAGHDVIPFFRDSDEIAQMGPLPRLAVAAGPVYSRRSARELDDLIDRHSPDVLHLHNPFPLISPWVVRVATGRGVPVVQTVHNYRHGCVAGTYFRNGTVCEDCLGLAVPWPAVQHGCYRGSRSQSLAMGAGQVIHRGTWRQVKRYLVLTAFMGSKLAQTGIPAERITVRPTAVADPGLPGPPGRGLLFLGRLTEEKGVGLLLDAWRQSGLGAHHELVLAGDGPLLDSCRAEAATSPGLRVLGAVPRETTSRLLAECAAVVAPSTWYEGFPRAVVEAFAHGRPVVATAIGSLAEVVDAEVGWLVTAAPAVLATALREAVGAASAPRGVAARGRYEQRYRADGALQQLVDVYRQVVGA